ATSVAVQASPSPRGSMPAPTRYCLNTSTIQGEKIPLERQVEIAATAGYDGIEIWLRDVERFLASGGKLSDLRKQLEDSRLKVESAIAFASWIVDDDAARTKGLEQAARDMEVVAALGGKRIAAPPAGATQGPKLDLDRAGERYRALLELGRKQGVVPMLEVWGFSANLSRLAEVLHVCAAADHPDACVLPDVYHLFKGGSNFADLGLLAGPKIPVFHFNDYPATPERAQIQDADRVYPGDGIAPLRQIFSTLQSNGFTGILSLELFNRTYWEQDPLEVARTGLLKLKMLGS
ncbi:MAG: sugar phosphate isomerase/epimerase family protein, partial [Planctomycetota bacterium]